MPEEVGTPVVAVPTSPASADAGKPVAKTYPEAEMLAMLKRAETAEGQLRKVQNDNRSLKKMEWYTNLEEEDRDRYVKAYTSQEKFTETLLKRYGLDETAKRYLEPLNDPEVAEDLAQKLSGKAVVASSGVDAELEKMGLREKPANQGVERTATPASAGASLAGREQVTSDNIDKFYLDGQVSGEVYREFLTTGKLP